MSRFSVEIFLSHSAGKKFGGILPCSNEILVMKTFVHRRGVVTFFRTFFCQTKPKNSKEGPLCFRKVMVARIKYGKERGYHVFPSKVFCLTVPEKNLEEHFCARMKFS